MSLFWEFYQQNEINTARGEANIASGKAERAKNKAQEFERKHVRQALASQAMWELIRERFDLTDQDLTDRMLEIDLRDGVADGKMTQRIVECPSCRRNSNSSRASCIYCGSILPKEHVFQ
ncbi:hypothetical protein [Cerasicoccus maritimus]|uniref:hypothetical protein n=1 Tax=Cerasicoccus maritimus TaxID=490089 RepID=UPI0028528878|nr:hypothetical protein [Cerasicoccus maritimus]